MTLKKDVDGSYTLDMTTSRYKTSRFYGPSGAHALPLERAVAAHSDAAPV